VPRRPKQIPLFGVSIADIESRPYYRADPFCRKGGPWPPPAKRPCEHAAANGVHCELESVTKLTEPPRCGLHFTPEGPSDGEDKTDRDQRDRGRPPDHL
jgi:hypothetical protein